MILVLGSNETTLTFLMSIVEEGGRLHARDLFAKLDETRRLLHTNNTQQRFNSCPQPANSVTIVSERLATRLTR